MKFIVRSNISWMLLLLMLAAPLHIEASPARRSDFTLVQPDGSMFMARLRGDEFAKILTTADGCSIMQDEEGWYCYAYYTSDGLLQNSGYRVGDEAPGTVMAESREIPYATIAARGREKRERAMPEDENIIRRLSAARGVGTKSSDTPVEKHGLVLLVQFSDLTFNHSKENFVSLLTDGYNGYPGAVEYFNSQFNGKFEFTFTVSDIITLPHGYSYYGKNDSGGNDMKPAEMVRDACRLADDRIDFSIFDEDGDGTVDNVFVFYAGPDEAAGAGTDHIWSHAWYLESGGGIRLTLDGVKIDRYACTAELSDSGNELAGIGTFCHEYSHTFGLPDLYDTDYEGSGGTSDALWAFTSLMDGGNYNDNGHTPPAYNAIEREILGIADITTITGEGRYELEPINENGKCYRIDGRVPGEYYLLECRSKSGWDRHIGGYGMLIYHIDKSDGVTDGVASCDRWEKENTVNCNPLHQCADLIEASRPNGEAGYTVQLAPIFFPYGEKTSFTATSDPSFHFWDGSVSDIEITGITWDDGEGKIMFNVENSQAALVPVPQIRKADIFQDAAIITWTTGAGYTGETDIVWGKTGGKTTVLSVSQYSEGEYAIVLEGLEPGTGYTMDLSCRDEGFAGQSTVYEFTTKAAVKSGRPYIYLKYVERNEDGTFPSGTGLPLRLFNAIDAESVVWTMDGKTVTVGDNGYYTPSSSGRLRAVATYSDGSSEIIVKEITLKEGEK